MEEPGFNSVAVLTVLLLASPKYINNPYLMAKLAEVNTFVIPFTLLSSFSSL